MTSADRLLQYLEAQRRWDSHMFSMSKLNVIAGLKYACASCLAYKISFIFLSGVDKFISRWIDITLEIAC